MSILALTPRAASLNRIALSVWGHSRGGRENLHLSGDVNGNIDAYAKLDEGVNDGLDLDLRIDLDLGLNSGLDACTDARGEIGSANIHAQLLSSSHVALTQSWHRHPRRDLLQG